MFIKTRDWKPELRACYFCGNEYMPYRPESKFCSKECYWEYTRKERVTRICIECGKEFSASPRSKKKLCGVKCRATRQICGHPYNCEVCGQEFYRPTSRQAGSHKERHCSRACADIGRRKGEYINCENCGKRVWKYPSTSRKYCSYKCSSEKRSSDHRKKLLLQGPIWKKNKGGYCIGQFPGHPLANKHGTIYRSWYNFYVFHKKADWLLRAKNLGATLHHKNGRHNDNPKYLELRWPGKHPQGLSNQDIIDILEMQGYEIHKEHIR